MKNFIWGKPDKRLIKGEKVLCPKCMKHPAILDNYYGVLPCEFCKAKQSHSNGRPINFTEGSKRIDKQRELHHKDLLQPHSYNKASKKLEINEEFINAFPDKAHLYYSKDEMKSAGFGRLARFTENLERTQSEEKKRIDEYKERKMSELSNGPSDGIKRLLGVK